jgi:hypothetical protein
VRTDEAKRRALELLDRHGLLDAGWRVAWSDNRARFGLTQHGERTILLSRPMVRLNHLPQVLECLRHEIAHALVGPDAEQHGEQWREKFLEIGGSGETSYQLLGVVTAERE